MIKNPGRIILVLVVLAFGVAGRAQKRSDLEKKRDALNQKISYTTEMLSKTALTRKEQQSEIQLLNRQISLREELIRTIVSEVGEISRQIAVLEDSLLQRKNELEKLKAEYAEMIRHAYKTENSHSQLMFIFAADNFNQAFSRMRYLKQYAEYRKQQGMKIELKNRAISRNIESLNRVKENKEILLASQKVEKQKLSSDVGRKAEKVASLKTEEQKLRRELQVQRQEKSRLDKAIQDLLAAEIKKNRSSAGGAFTLTPEAAALSNTFEQNKGKLPWPVERGVITSHFGRQAHPVLSGVYVENNGVTISTEKEAEVRAIFSGTVSNIIIIPGAGKVVMINHGAYRSLYTGLKDVFVSKNQKVTTKSVIGRLLPSDANKSEAHLEIWKISDSGTDKLDPARWIYRR